MYNLLLYVYTKLRKEMIMDLNIELKDLSLNLELKPLEAVELNLSLDETKSLTGRSE